jgi:low temperature requirement protein LtrA
VDVATADERAGRVSSLELFFDLVFVFTLTQLTGLLAAEPNWTGLLKVVLILTVIYSAS